MGLPVVHQSQYSPRHIDCRHRSCRWRCHVWWRQCRRRRRCFLSSSSFSSKPPSSLTTTPCGASARWKWLTLTSFDHCRRHFATSKMTPAKTPTSMSTSRTCSRRRKGRRRTSQLWRWWWLASLSASLSGLEQVQPPILDFVILDYSISGLANWTWDIGEKLIYYLPSKFHLNQFSSLRMQFKMRSVLQTSKLDRNIFRLLMLQDSKVQI